MKALGLVFMLFYASLIHAQNNKIVGPSNEKSDFFVKAKLEFEDFESKHGRFIKTPNADVHYLPWGNPNDLPLIWSHGSFSNKYELLHIANVLVDSGYYIIAVDYYGHWQTTLPKHNVSLYHVADDIKFIMNHLKIDKAIIGGW